MRSVVAASFAAIAITLAAPPALAKPKAGDSAAAETQALDMAKRLIAIRSVRGPGNQTPAAQKVVKDALLAAGWKDGEVEIVPVDDTAYLIAT